MIPILEEWLDHMMHYPGKVEFGQARTEPLSCGVCGLFLARIESIVSRPWKGLLPPPSSIIPLPLILWIMNK